jgi:SAM-dependent methyltransferase
MNIFDLFKNKLKERMLKERFFPTKLSIILSPVYIVRSCLLKAIMSYSPRIDGDVLDFGCGSKPYEALFKNAKSYVGLELQFSGHNHQDSNVDYYYKGERLPFADNSFDCVVCFEVLEHVFNVDDILIELSRVLKPKGHFLVTLPFVWEEHEVPYDFARYSSYGIRHLLSRHNFNVIELTKSGTYVLTVGQLIINYVSQNLLTNNILLSLIVRLMIIFPLNLFFLFANWALPKRNSLYCNNIVISQNFKPSK